VTEEVANESTIMRLIFILHLTLNQVLFLKSRVEISPMPTFDEISGSMTFDHELAEHRLGVSHPFRPEILQEIMRTCESRVDV